jgi:AICAR transformylase/IMP cyclohydrolase PurH
MFYEIVVAPSYTAKGLEVLKGKSKTLRILEAKKQNKGKHSLRQVGGGWLLQEADDISSDEINFVAVTEKTPTEQQIEDAKFAWLCVKHVKSNAIVVAKVKNAEVICTMLFSSIFPHGLLVLKTFPYFVSLEQSPARHGKWATQSC